MKKLVTIILMLLLVLLVFSGCKSYTIPIDSFKEQFKNINTENYRMVKTENPFGIVSEYKANPIDKIICFDKNNKKVLLRNSPSIEIKFTTKDHKKKTFYFDRIFLNDTIVIGDMSRFINYKKGIPIDNIIKIEVQDSQRIINM